MTLRAQYALGHSEFNEFLFAIVGEEKNGMQLTVLSALTRLGLDPWGEASRLSGMSRESAARVLAVVIAHIPPGVWEVTDAPAIAARLVECLPGPRAPASAPAKSHRDPSRKVKPWGVKWLFVIGFAGVALFLLLHLNDSQPPGPVPGGFSSSPH